MCAKFSLYNVQSRMRENGTLRYSTKKKKAEVQLIFKIIFFKWIMSVNVLIYGQNKKTSKGNTSFMSIAIISSLKKRTFRIFFYFFFFSQSVGELLSIQRRHHDLQCFIEIFKRKPNTTIESLYSEKRMLFSSIAPNLDKYLHNSNPLETVVEFSLTGFV